jgi:hypothetical protein
MATIVVLAHLLFILDGVVEGRLDKVSVGPYIGGFIFMVAVLYWLSRGSAVAWWIVVVVFGLAGLLNLVVAFNAEKPSIFNVLLPRGWPDPDVALDSIAGLSFVGVLLFSGPVREYLGRQRAERSSA